MGVGGWVGGRRSAEHGLHGVARSWVNMAVHVRLPARRCHKVLVKWGVEAEGVRRVGPWMLL